LAKAFLAANEPVKAAPYAAEAFAISRSLAADPSLRTVGLDLAYDNALLLFDAHRLSGEIAPADNSLEELRKTAASHGNSVFYFYAADKLITYRIETGRKPLALETYLSTLIAASKELPLEGQRNDAIQRLRKREKHYKLLGEPAPEFQTVDKWFPGTPVKVADLRGKVVLIDFWATWCPPCVTATPGLKRLHERMKDQPFVILGISADRSRDAWQSFIVEKGLKWHHYLDERAEIRRAFTIEAFPTYLLLDHEGIVRQAWRGYDGSVDGDIERNAKKLIKAMTEK